MIFQPNQDSPHGGNSTASLPGPPSLLRYRAHVGVGPWACRDALVSFLELFGLDQLP